MHIAWREPARARRKGTERDRGREGRSWMFSLIQINRRGCGASRIGASEVPGTRKVACDVTAKADNARPRRRIHGSSPCSQRI